MSTVEAPREQEQIIGTVTGVVQKGADKWQAVVAPDGSQYTKNLWTKDIASVQYLTSMIGQRLAFLCNVSHWTNNQGQPVRSLWIDQVGPPGVGSPAMAGPQPQPQQQGGWNQPAQPQQNAVVQPVVTPMVAPAPQQAPQEDQREKKIHRQTASKVAAILLSNLPQEERNISTLLVISERLVSYYDSGLPQAETLDELMTRAMPQGMESPAAQGTGYQNTPPPAGDDDIPF